MSEYGNRAPIVEALILSSPEPLPTSKIISILQNITAGDIDKIVVELNEKYLMNDASFRIRKIAGGYQMYVTENYAGYVEELFTRRRTQKLTRAALETLAIIAYRQPVTRVDIEMIRGVSSDSAIRTLLERKFITLSGRAKTIGRPLLYSSTDEFLKYFSLNSLNDLPKMEEIEELLSEKESESQQILAFESVKNVQNSDLPKEETEIIEPPVTYNTDDIIDTGDASDSESTGDVDDTGDASDTDDVIDTDDIRDTDDASDIESTSDVDDAGDASDTDNVIDTDGINNTDDASDIDNKGSAEKASDIDNAGSAEKASDVDKTSDAGESADRNPIAEYSENQFETQAGDEEKEQEKEQEKVEAAVNVGTATEEF